MASVCWLLLAGCNRIFGIAATQPWDAPPDVVPDMPHVTLTWQLATTTSSGGPSPQLEYPPFAAGTAPPVRVATIDGPFMPAIYSSEAETPGWIVVPRSFFPPAGTAVVRPWRLEYTLGGVPHEVQWTPDDKIGHLVVPMVGRLDRPPVPGGSGYQVTLTNFTFPTTGPIHNPSVLTTGLWTAGATSPPTGTMVDYAFANASSLSGARGSPSTTPSDRGFLVDYVNNPDGGAVQCNVAVGSTQLTSLALSAGAHTPQMVAWDTLRQPVKSDVPGLSIVLRLITALGKLNTTGVSALDSQLVFGSVPSISFPGLIGSAPTLRLPAPVMQTLLQCPVGPNAPGPMSTDAIPMAARPSMLGSFPTAVHVQMVDPRTAMPLGVTLYSGIEAVVPASDSGEFKLSFPAAIPTQITLTTAAGPPLDLVDNTDQIPTGPLTGQFTLDFVPETGVGLRADYYDVYLHRINGTMLAALPDRIYTVTTPQVKIDASLLASGADYVFEIRSYSGHVMASRGDFAPVDYPYGSAVVFTRTVRTP
ncbi:MAG TPA: hypothetical protein VHW23_31355 [Kofleriaceae bacterium]|nr:hypothetical protein [Kofleriaceae bacterium]